MSIKNPPALYDQVRVPAALWRAWRHVRSKGSKSVKRQTRVEIAEFDKVAERSIRSLSRRLRRRSFQFEPATGVAKKRPGKAARPIVIAPVETRIVQRSLLDTLYQIPELTPYIKVPTSFGMRGVPPAIEVAYRLMREGNGAYYIRSDIEGFFTQMPRSRPLGTIAELVDDEDFNALLAKAMDVDLANAANLGDDVSLFPDEAGGVAQGCALSAFLGDVLLAEFDREMNGRGITCLRYVDDFILLGPTPSAVGKVFTKAQDILGKLNLHAYDPAASNSKAAQGWTNRKWEFLGCEILPGIIRPSAKSKRGLLEKVDRIIEESCAAINDPASVRQRGASFTEATADLDRLIRGWGNHYQFCNDAGGFQSLESAIQQRLARMARECRAAASKQSGPEEGRNRQRILGVHVLSDSKHNPITEQLDNDTE